VYPPTRDDAPVRLGPDCAGHSPNARAVRPFPQCDRAAAHARRWSSRATSPTPFAGPALQRFRAGVDGFHRAAGSGRKPREKPRTRRPRPALPRPACDL